MSTDNMQDETVDSANEEAEESSAQSVEDEGDVAADYLEELLDIADIDGDIDIEVRNGRTYISIVSEGSDTRGLQSLVGRDGEVLEALQELARLSVLTSTDNRSRLVLDVDGFRETRNKELHEIAERAVRKVKESGDDVALEPMSAYERKIVHDVVADLGMVSESEGEGSGRHIVVSAGS
ncbi:spoIIIJ-associated protein [Arthrobacter pigmenti]|uniref:SpoIIIJ-associated protein n=2 Tax=Arthrobacter pigmenti TaxID=271432 RepID=A0A846RLU9_9MICC|nr:spoIIIJ-associated protein [Arthrobacter pigmenti]